MKNFAKFVLFSALVALVFGFLAWYAINPTCGDILFLMAFVLGGASAVMYILSLAD